MTEKLPVIPLKRFIGMLVLVVLGTFVYQTFEPGGIFLLCSAACCSWYKE